MVRLSDFLAKVREIDKEHPVYKKGSDGTGGACDCIGLIIGAIRRAGGKWTGTHGSNYAARYEVKGLRKVTSVQDLQIGDAVFKKYEPGELGWDLPSTYKNHPDQRDYYHAGVVLSVNPLDICHCTSPSTKHDTSLGKWAYAARLSKVDYGESGALGSAGVENGNEEVNIMEALYQARVATEKDPLRLRNAPENGNVLGHAPKGATVDVLDENNPLWPRVRYGELVGYASGEYLRRIDEAKERPNTPAEGNKIRITFELPVEAAAELWKALDMALGKD